ncbi:MAG: DUF1501 domain-containing protein [Pseudomonadota bacterium]
MLSRRRLLQSTLATCAIGPGLSLANAATDRRFLMLILRGAADGLALLPPYAEPGYAKLRGELAIAAPGRSDGAHKIDGTFGLHPAFDWLAQRFADGQALGVHAVASPYRERSHFDGQDALENGTATALGRRDGWLNRAIAPLGGKLGDEVAIALGTSTPLILRGDQSVANWAPSRLPGADDDTLARLARLYEKDEFLHMRLAQAMQSQAIADDAGTMSTRRRGNAQAQFRQTMIQAGNFLATEDGPRIAVVDSGGWDTHANQGGANGGLANRFRGLDQGLAAFQSTLGDAWQSALILVVTEFGRTVRVNGTRGTDHGTAGAALLVGGNVDGGRVIADWPGLNESALYQGRDLYPTTDLRALCKGVVTEHLGLDPAIVDRSVFPDSGNVKPLTGLTRRRYS